MNTTDLSVDDLNKFLAELKAEVYENSCEQIYFLACLQYGLCARVQEAAAISFEDFDLEKNKVHINKKVIWPRAKGLATFVSQGAKSNQGKSIPLTNFTKKHFLDWVCRSGIRKGLLFRNEQNEPLSYRHIEYRYTRALKRAGLPFTATHILRHASLTELYSATQDIKVVARFAGHSTIRTTEIYAKARDDRMVDAAQRLDEKLKSLETMAAFGSK